MRLKFLLAIIFLLLHCSKDFSPVAKSDLKLQVKGGTIQNPGDFKIINTSYSDIFIPYIQYPYCSFFLYGIQEEKNKNWKNLFYEDDNNLWTGDSTTDSIFVVCEMYMSPLILKPDQKHKGKIEGRVLNSGNYKLVIRYSFREHAKPEEYKQAETIFTVTEP